MKIADDEYNSTGSRWQDQVHKSNKNGVWVEMATTGSHIEECHFKARFRSQYPIYESRWIISFIELETVRPHLQGESNLFF